VSERGSIRSDAQARALRIFEGLQWNRITPTDIDLFIDFGDKAFVFAEFKHGIGALDIGQRKALERLCDRCERGGVRSIVLIGRRHGDGDFLCKDSIVTEFRWQGKWATYPDIITVHEAIDRFVKRHVEVAA
jgi:hypothetical protein